MLNGEGLSVLPVWMEGTRDFRDVLRPASDDEVSESSHFWVADEGLLKASLQVSVMWAWWIVISNGRSGPGWGLNQESMSGMTISLPGW